MTLSFQKRWGKEMGELAGMPNHFVEKIWTGLIEKTSLSIEDYSNANYDHVNRFGNDMSDYKDLFIDPKFHTIRHDPRNRWREGMDIHFVINNRTKDRFQFAPVVKCMGVQEIKIKWNPIDTNGGGMKSKRIASYTIFPMQGNWCGVQRFENHRNRFVLYHVLPPVFVFA